MRRDSPGGAVPAAALVLLMTVLPAGAADPVATFSIVARDPETGDLGVAVESRFFAVGAVVPWARAGAGAVATQAFAQTTFGPRGLDLLARGSSAQEALDILVGSDGLADRRQVGLVDAKGRTATWTGKRCNAWAGGKVGAGYAVQGNILTGPEVVDAMAAAFEASAGRPLADRLVEALLAGQHAGGDSRGQQSAALLVVRRNGGYAGLDDRYIDLRVDDHPAPIDELKRLLEMHHVVNAFSDARWFMERGQLDRAVSAMESAAERALADPKAKDDDRGGAHYDLACFYALAGMTEKSLASLETAFHLSPRLRAYSLNDTDLDSLRDDPRYRAMVKDATPGR